MECLLLLINVLGIPALGLGILGGLIYSRRKVFGALFTRVAPALLGSWGGSFSFFLFYPGLVSLALGFWLGRLLAW